MTVRYSSDQPGNQPPVAAFTSNCSGLNCNLDATGTEDPDGTIVNYTWDFGDGKTGTGPTISHSYDAGGIYSVVLTVTDDGGATDMQSQGVEVISRRMFVSSISMSGSRVFTGRSAKAVITILDTKGNPVSGASVSGAWGGNYTKNVSGTTSTSGTVSFTSARVYKANATFTFTVKGVVKSTYVYDPGINKETVDTIVVP
jgi:PKD repeat protein